MPSSTQLDPAKVTTSEAANRCDAPECLLFPIFKDRCVRGVVLLSAASASLDRKDCSRLAREYMKSVDLKWHDDFSVRRTLVWM